MPNEPVPKGEALSWSAGGVLGAAAAVNAASGEPGMMAPAVALAGVAAVVDAAAG
jgi:hypothetical protein